MLKIHSALGNVYTEPSLRKKLVPSTNLIECIDINISDPGNRLPCLSRTSNDLLHLVSLVWDYQIDSGYERNLFVSESNIYLPLDGLHLRILFYSLQKTHQKTPRLIGILHSYLVFRKSSFQWNLQATLIFVNTFMQSLVNNVVRLPRGKENN